MYHVHCFVVTATLQGSYHYPQFINKASGVSASTKILSAGKGGSSSPGLSNSQAQGLSTVLCDFLTSPFKF